MKTFENFIESEAFFPVLILLLVMLVCVFIWIIMSNKKEAKKRRDKKKIKIDENAEIKIFSDGYDETLHTKKILKEKVEDEPERTEIAIVEEVKGKSPVINYNMSSKKETIYDIDLPNFNEGRFNESNENDFIDYKNVDYGDLSIPVVPEIFKDTSYPKMDADKDDSRIASKEFNTEVSGVKPEFLFKPEGDKIVQDDEKIDTPKEYEEEKTEVFDFPDFNKEDIFKSGDIESEIINAAENYIKDIMSKKQ